MLAQIVSKLAVSLPATAGHEPAADANSIDFAVPLSGVNRSLYSDTEPHQPHNVLKHFRNMEEKVCSPVKNFTWLLPATSILVILLMLEQ